MNDDQLGFDIPVDTTTEETPWAMWADPQRQAAQVRKLLTRAELPALPSEPWDFEKDEPNQLNDVVAELFPDLDAVKQDADVADQLVCMIGQWFTKYLDATWVDVTGLPTTGINDTTALTLYAGFTPALAFPHPGWKTCTADVFVEYVVANEFLRIVELVGPGYWRLRKAGQGGPLFSELAHDSDAPPFM
ncbi:hypothetical protein [Nocardia thraciensis]